MRPATAALLLALLGSSVAEAQSAPAFAWLRAPGAESCGAEAAVARRADATRSAVGEPVEAHGAIRVEARVTREDDGFAAILEVFDVDTLLGTRELRVAGASCELLVDQAVFVAA